MFPFLLGSSILTGIAGLIGFFFYKASPLPEPDLHQAERASQTMYG